jgi:hypothetical protein
MSEIGDDIKNTFEHQRKRYREHLPKVDPDLVDSLLVQKEKDPSTDPMFMVEVFTKPGLDPQQVRSYILQKTGMAPEIYDNGTHYVTNQKLNLDILKEISDSEDVIEITGEYTGRLGGYGASHEHRDTDTVGRGVAGRGVPVE